MEKFRNNTTIRRAAAVLLTGLVLLCGACGSAEETRIFDLDPAEVTAVTIQKQETRLTWDDPAEIARQVELLNDLRYLEKETMEPGGGWTYRLLVETGEGTLDLIIGPSGLRMDGEDGMDVIYTLPEGALQPFIDAIE